MHINRQAEDCGFLVNVSGMDNVELRQLVEAIDYQVLCSTDDPQFIREVTALRKRVKARITD